MQVEFDSDKRDKTLAERGLDFPAQTTYGELRFVTVGWLDGRTVVMVWTPRGEARRIISMRKANEREISKYTLLLG